MDAARLARLVAINLAIGAWPRAQGTGSPPGWSRSMWGSGASHRDRCRKTDWLYSYKASECAWSAGCIGC